MRSDAPLPRMSASMRLVPPCAPPAGDEQQAECEERVLGDVERVGGRRKAIVRQGKVIRVEAEIGRDVDELVRGDQKPGRPVARPVPAYPHQNRDRGRQGDAGV